jgi:ATP dependent DNA ligase domain
MCRRWLSFCHGHRLVHTSSRRGGISVNRRRRRALSCRSCLIDGEVVICGEDGIPVFDRLRYGYQPQTEAVLFAFDLLELGGKDLRRAPLEERKGALAKLVRKASWAVQLKRRRFFAPAHRSIGLCLPCYTRWPGFLRERQLCNCDPRLSARHDQSICPASSPSSSRRRRMRVVIFDVHGSESEL